MSGFVKLDCGILDSSLWMEPSDVCKVFITILAMCEPDGLCRATAPGIARRACLSLDAVRTALDRLAAADPDSRTTTDEGRRLKRVNGGVLVVNYAAYRQRDYTATERKRRQRERERQVSTLPPDPPQQADADAYAYAYESQSVTSVTRDIRDTKGASAGSGGGSNGGCTHECEGRTRSRSNRGSGRAPSPEVAAVAERFVRAYNATFGRRVTALPALVDDIAARLAAGYTAEQLVCVPILTDALGLPEDLRKSLQPRWLLRIGANPRTGRDGQVSGAKDWIGAALDRAHGTRLWPRHVEAARAAGVLEPLLNLGARASDDDAEATT